MAQTIESIMTDRRRVRDELARLRLENRRLRRAMAPATELATRPAGDIAQWLHDTSLFVTHCAMALEDIDR